MSKFSNNLHSEIKSHRPVLPRFRVIFYVFHCTFIIKSLWYNYTEYSIVFIECTAVCKDCWYIYLFLL